MGFKLKTRTMFPADVVAQSPLTVTKVGRKYTFGVDSSQGALGPAGAGYGGTSTTSLAIGTGSKSFSTQSGYAYQAGNYLRASSAADGTNYMEGTITSYANIGTGLATLILNVSKVGGSGTKTDWTFSLSGTPGATGAGTGDMLAAQNLADVSNKKTSKDNISIHGADVASAGTINLETATGDLVDVTGTTTITAITLNEGHERTVRFTGALTLTHGASLVLPGAANITTAAGDFAVFRGYAASVVRCVSYDRASGTTAAAAAFLASPTSANLAAALSDETGSGVAVFATSPTITTPLVVGRTPTSSTVTISNASPGVVTWTANGLVVNAPVFFETTGGLPTGLTAAVKAAGAVAPQTYLANPTLYYVKTILDANTFTVSATPGGAAINTSSAGSGTHTAFANAMIPTGFVGEIIYKRVAAISTGLTTAVDFNWANISVTQGIWLIGGSSEVFGGAGCVFTHMHASINYGIGTSISSAPFNGTTAAHITSNNSNGWAFTNTPEQVFFTTTTQVNGTMQVDFSGGTAGAAGVLWARRIA